MKKIMYYIVTSVIIFSSIVLTGCEDDNDGNNFKNIVEGPSADDVLAVPAGDAFHGDSIQLTKSFSLADYKIAKVTVLSTQNGHVAVLGGYKDQSAIYIYAKAEDEDKDRLTDEQIKAVLEKYYHVESYAEGSEIVAKVSLKADVQREADFYNLRITVKVYAPQNVSTNLTIAGGSIFANNVQGKQHTASATEGAVKYINSYGENFTINLESGYIGIINTKAITAISTKLVNDGNIMLAIPGNTKANLNLTSQTKVNSYILNRSNFSGTNNNLKVEGKINGGGYRINADSGLGVVNLRWYE